MRSKGRPFAKGQSGNPSGRPPLPADIKRARGLTRVELERIINKYLHMTADGLAQAMTAKETTVIEAMVIGIVRAGIIEGDPKRLDFILDRLIGKVPVKTDTTHTFSLSGMPRAQAIELGKEAVAFLEQQEKDEDE